ncbi:hypothetical protein OIU76_012709 [Salix suchowensis]|nr:hypothetical protein OIU76_012709 [Salix suchowensis]
MKIPAIFKGKETKHPWQKWPSCKHPKTLSFRAGDDVIKTVNSVFFDPSEGVETPESWFTDSSETTSFSAESEDYDGESLEVVVRGARSERSMEEMVESHGLKDWDCLKELLGWYLKVNGKKNHGYIVGAFVDLLVGIAAAPSSDSTFSSSSPLCSLKVHGEIDEEEQMGRAAEEAARRLVI